MLPNIWANGLSSASSQITARRRACSIASTVKINVALKTSEVREKVVLTGSIITGGSAAQFGERIASNVDLYRKIFALTASKPK